MVKNWQLPEVEVSASNHLIYAKMPLKKDKGSIIGHSAGFYGGMVLFQALTEVAFLQLVGITWATAIALPVSLLKVRYGSSCQVPCARL